jgi:CRP-like cAMP-binding protein
VEELRIGRQEVSELAKIIRNLGVFRNLTVGLIDEVCEQMRLFRYNEDEVVLREGDEGKGFFLIKDGSLQVLQNKKKGFANLRKEQVTVNMMRTGDFFGEIALTSTWKHTATVQCQRSTEVYMLPGNAFRKIMRQNDRFAGMVEDSSYDRLKNSKEHLGAQAVRSSAPPPASPNHSASPPRAAQTGSPPPAHEQPNARHNAPPPPAPDHGHGGDDPWEILGVAQGTGRTELKKAYHNKVRQFHPDRYELMGPELRSRAEEQTKRINAAYTSIR